jgi:hypothetical protein
MFQERSFPFAWIVGLAWLSMAHGACGVSPGSKVNGELAGGGMGGGDAGLTIDLPDACAGQSPRCSGDLHQVLDCDGHPVETCPDDQGCAAGKCVKACDAATANQSAVGCDYFSFAPDTIGALNTAGLNSAGDCFAAYVVNTWSSPVTISVDRGGYTLNSLDDFARIPSGSGLSLSYAPLPGGQLPPGQMAILFLAGHDKAFAPCPAGVVTAYDAGDPAVHGTAIGSAFHIRTDRPVVAYDIYPYAGGATGSASATLLLPTASWGTNYLAVDAYPGDASLDFLPWTAIVASENGTQVTLSPTADVQGGTGVAPTAKGKPSTYMLDQGQILQFTQLDELTGSAIQSTKPIGVWGGTTCMYVPKGFVACDAAHQQLPPVRSLGHEYVVARYRDRYAGAVESPPVRIVGAVDGTTLVYDPSPPAGAPATIGRGQVVELSSSEAFSVKSQGDDHPFYVAQYMTGSSAYQGTLSDSRGDPEFVNVVPPQQFQLAYTLFTDPTYPETELVVVRAQGSSGFADVSLDCAGALSGWQPVGTAGLYEWTRVDLVTGNFEAVGSCDNGRHEIHSAAPFGVTVWGWGSEASGGDITDPTAPGFFSQSISYAYPAGTGLTSITPVVVTLD